MNPLTVAVAGATGAVGTQMLRVLEERNFPAGTVRPLASARSKGKLVSFGGKQVPVEVLETGCFEGVDLALFSAGGKTSREAAPDAVRSGCTVIDNSSAWRADPNVPLVVPEVNASALARHQGIVANPNCSTIQMVVALKPLHDEAGISRVIVSTYQAVSGKSGRAIGDLASSSGNYLKNAFSGAVAGTMPPLGNSPIFPKDMAFNVSFDWPFAENAFTEEEMKMTSETVKIMEDDSIRVTATTARVPVFRSHAEAVYIETRKKLTADRAREILRSAPGIVVVDDPAKKEWPTPREAEGRDETFVGRIREDFTHEKALWLWVVSDNLLKGAALNAVQIAEKLLEKGLLKPAKRLFT